MYGHVHEDGRSCECCHYKEDGDDDDVLVVVAVLVVAEGGGRGVGGAELVRAAVAYSGGLTRAAAARATVLEVAMLRLPYKQ